MKNEFGILSEIFKLKMRCASSHGWLMEHLKPNICSLSTMQCSLHFTSWRCFWKKMKGIKRSKKHQAYKKRCKQATSSSSFTFHKTEKYLINDRKSKGWCLLSKVRLCAPGSWSLVKLKHKLTSRALGKRSTATLMTHGYSNHRTEQIPTEVEERCWNELLLLA